MAHSEEKPTDSVQQVQHIEDDVSSGEEHVGQEEKPKLSRQTILAVISLLVMYNAYLYTLLMPPAILAFINADLGPSTNYVWITICWNLCAAVIVTISGRLADIFGRRYFLLVGTAISSIGAVVGATGQGIPQMIASGILFGIGGGFQEMVFACVQEMVPNRYRFTLLGCTEVSNWFSQFSPLISYAFIAHTKTGWRACYWWSFTFEVIAFVGIFFLYKPPTFQTKHQDDHKTKMELLKELDYVGLVMFASACTLLLLGINWGNGAYHWKSPHVVAPIVISGVLFIALGFWESYADLKIPILPPKLFRRIREFTSILVVVFIAGMLYYSMGVLWPSESSLLFVPADKIIIRGVYANMTAFGVMLAGGYSLGIMPWIGHERWQLVFLTCIQTAMIGALSTVGLHDAGKAIAFVIINGASATSVSPLIFGMISLGLVDQTDIGVSNGLVSTSRLIGGAVAQAIYNSIKVNKYASEAPAKITKAATAAGFTGSIKLLLKASALNTAAAYKKVPGITPGVIAATQLAIKESYVDAFRLVYLVAIAFGVLAIAAALTTKSIDAHKKSNLRAVHLENEKEGGMVEKV